MRGAGTNTGEEGVDYGRKGHYLQRNVLVVSELFSKPFEFELTRSLHLSSEQGNGSMMFKSAPPGQLLEAWRILIAAARKHTLFPDEVHSWHGEVLRKYGDEDKDGIEPAPGSSKPPTMPPPDRESYVSKVTELKERCRKCRMESNRWQSKNRLYYSEQWDDPFLLVSTKIPNEIS